MVSSNDDKCKKEILKIVPEYTALYSADDMIKGVMPSELLKKGCKELVPESGLIESLSECQNIFVPMMERLNYSNISSIKIIEYYYKYLSVWNGIINHLEPDCIIFHNTPHEGANFIIYHLAQYYGIQTLIPEIVLRSGSFFFLEKIYEFPVYEEKNLDLSIPAKELGQLSRVQELTKSAFDKKNYTHDVIDRIKNKIARVLNIFERDLDPVYSLSDSYPAQWKSNIYKAIEKLSVRRLRKFYTNKSIAPDLSSKYIYLPLHFQPERSTLPMGRHYWNHQVVVDYLTASLPLDWKIYIKDHPMQFSRSELRVSLVRSQAFYDNLTKHPSVELIDLEFDSNELIESSMCVATITGTAGWEALLKNKPVCVFGYPWYVNCPEIYKVESNSLLKKYLQEINDGNVKIDAGVLNSYAYWVKEKLCYNASLNPSYVKEEDKKENSIEIAKAMLSAINRNRSFKGNVNAKK